jgi:hypothetical protein
VLAPGNPAAWLGRARCSLRQDRYDESLGYIDKALALDPGDRKAKQLRAEAASLKEKGELEGCARQVLDFEQRSGRMPTREEVFRDCKVPFEKLDRVLGHISSTEPVDLPALSPSERDELDAMSSDLIRKIQPGAAIRLSDAVKLLPGASVIRGKRVLGYIEAVRGAPVTVETPLDPRTEERSRAGLHLPDEERDLFGLVRRLNLPLREARRVEEVVRALKSGRPLPSPPAVMEAAAAEVPESELEAAPGTPAPERKPRRPRKKPAVEAPAAEAGSVVEESKEPPEKEPELPAAAAEEAPGAEEKEAPGEEEEALEPEPEKPARRPRRKKAPDEAAAGEPAGEAEDEEKEPLDEQKMQDISDSIKDIVSSIEKRQTKEAPDEKAAEAGRRGRTYCSVCHSIIATIHHGCGAHLCSRCVIDFNKDRRAERNLCPKCLKPIESAPPPAGARTGWRDTL